MSDQLFKYEPHICNEILFIYNSIVKMPPFSPTNLVFKRHLRNLSKGHYALNEITLVLPNKQRAIIILLFRSVCHCPCSRLLFWQEISWDVLLICCLKMAENSNSRFALQDETEFQQLSGNDISKLKFNKSMD